MINVYQIDVKAVCTKQIPFIKVQEIICESIDHSFNISKEMKEFHNTNKYKNYVFTSLKPFLAKDDEYKVGNLVTFGIRTTNEILVKHFTDNLPGLECNSLTLVTANVNKIPNYKIEEIITESPIVIKSEIGYWRRDYDDTYFLDKVTSSMIKRYNSITGENVSLNFELFEDFEFRKTNVKRNYKNIVLIGDHCNFKIKDNELANKIAYMSIGTGLCDNCARGFGVVTYKYRKGA